MAELVLATSPDWWAAEPELATSAMGLRAVVLWPQEALVVYRWRYSPKRYRQEEMVWDSEAQAACTRGEQVARTWVELNQVVAQLHFAWAQLGWRSKSGNL